MTTKGSTTSTNTTTYDLIVLPQLGYFLPGAHLTDKDRAAVINDWKTPTADTAGSWTIAVAHTVSDSELAITSTLSIPRS